MFKDGSREHRLITGFTKDHQIDFKTLEQFCLDKVYNPITGVVQLITVQGAYKHNVDQKMIEYYTYNRAGQLCKLAQQRVYKDSRGKLKKLNSSI